MKLASSQMEMNNLFLLVLNITAVCSLSCNEILELPDGKSLTINELKSMAQQEIVQCHAHLGKEPLGRQEADYIWQTIIGYYDGIPNIPDKVLTLLHWITTAITPEDIANITFSEIDVIQNFGLNYNLDEDQLFAIADKVREDFAGKEPEDYTYYDLTALRQILCAFNRSEIERIRPKGYREAALLIGKLENCDPEVMSGFATLATDPSAFGDPVNWTPKTIKILGAVAEYFPKEILDILPTQSKANNM